VTDSKPSDRSYKRSWKNLLINKRYQLRFTLFMVGLASLLMIGLGVWVMRVANETTTISMASVRGEACPKVPSFSGPARVTGPSTTPTPMPAEDGLAPGKAAATGAANAPDPASAGGAGPGDAASAGADSAAGSGDAVGSGDDRRATVQIEESSMTLTPPPVVRPQVPPDLADQIATHWRCELRQVARFDRLERGRLRILWAMIGTGVLLVLGLAAYGLKMTHRVAGPLFKVRLYLTKMRQGRFDTVYNLRKGDQLVHFYDHFKLAHGGVVAMQRGDIDKIAAVIAAAEAAGAGQNPAVVELRELLARKEKSVE
jgi:hypothetical protein